MVLERTTTCIATHGRHMNRLQMRMQNCDKQKKKDKKEKDFMQQPPAADAL
jgi:hypothetical protein